MPINRIVAFSKQVFQALKYHNVEKNKIEKTYKTTRPIFDPFRIRLGVYEQKLCGCSPSITSHSMCLHKPKITYTNFVEF